ncbi:MAG: acetyl-CoA carboxylase biotin carboxyl carrier protein subunit [Chloroflexota bacterium]
MTGPLRVVVTGVDDDLTFELPAGEVPVDPRLVRMAPPLPEAEAAGRRRFEVTVDGWVIAVAAEPAARAALRERALRAGGGAEHAGPQAIRARIPGRVVRIWVEVGQEVAVGDRLLSVEAMKMENEVRSPVAGVVRVIGVAVGDRVELHAELAVVGS